MNERQVIFFLGRSGAGKGTQARLLSGRLNFFYWEMGGIIRKEIEKQTSVGLEMASLVTKGIWLDDEHLVKVIESHIDEVPVGMGIVFDGLPRRPGQAKYLVELLKKRGYLNFATIFLDVPVVESVNRLHHRASVEHRVDDSSEAAIRLRMEQFESETLPTAEYLKTVGEFFVVDGRPEVEVVEVNIDKALGMLS